MITVVSICTHGISKLQIMRMTIAIWLTVFVFPHQLAAMTIPLSEAIRRNPLMTNSRRIHELSEIRDQIILARDLAVQHIREGCRAENSERGPFHPPLSPSEKEKDDEGNNKDHSQYGELIR